MVRQCDHVEVRTPFVNLVDDTDSWHRPQGALLFLETCALAYANHFNLLVLPCVSPWGYENIQRWTPNAVDPNRAWGALASVSCDETKAAMALLDSLGVSSWTCHVDLHETTDTDASEFTPAKCARDGAVFEQDIIPDGFYLVSNSDAPQTAWNAAIIDSVRKVTHIAPPDANGAICDEPIAQVCCKPIPGAYPSDQSNPPAPVLSHPVPSIQTNVIPFHTSTPHHNTPHHQTLGPPRNTPSKGTSNPSQTISHSVLSLHCWHHPCLAGLRRA